MIHKYRLFDSNIVLDNNCNAVYLFDEESFYVLDFYDKENGIFDKQTFSSAVASKDMVIQQQLFESKDEIDRLIEQGALFAKADDGEQFHDLESTYVFKSMCLHMAHDCNMNCGYCFASAGDFGMKRELMTLEVAKQAIDFIAEASKSRRNIEIDFFGGEPLLNWDVVRETVAYAREVEKHKNKNFRFTMTTNGVLLDEKKIRYINENMDNLVLSIDGRKETNDNMRKLLDGSGSYDVILPNFQAIIAGRGDKSYYLRGTYTAHNKDFSKDVLHLADLGFKQLSIEPVVSPTDKTLDFKEGDIEELMKEYEQLALEMKERNERDKGFAFFHFNVDLERGPCLARKLKGCGAGYEYAAVAPNGDIYPCHQFVGNDAFLLGNVGQGVSNHACVDMFKKSTIYTKKKCSTCWAKYFCSGGCAANAYNYNSDINEPNELYCTLLKKRIECAIWLQLQLNANE